MPAGEGGSGFSEEEEDTTESDRLVDDESLDDELEEVDEDPVEWVLRVGRGG